MRQRRLFLVGLAAVSTLLLGTVGATAGTLTVTVTNGSNGQSIAGAAVCVGGVNNRNYWGQTTTNSQGMAVFNDLPTDTTVTVTASKDGFQGSFLTYRVLNSYQMNLQLSPGSKTIFCPPAPAPTRSLRPLSGQPVSTMVQRAPATQLCTWKSGSLWLSELLIATKQAGFVFDEINESPGSLCGSRSLSQNDITVIWGRRFPGDPGGIPGEQAAGTKCDARLFSGKKLATGWKIKRIQRSGPVCQSGNGWRFDRWPSPGSDSLEVKAHVWSDAFKSCSFKITEVQLEGPAGQDCYQGPFGVAAP